jgi:hypothetical protein
MTELELRTKIKALKAELNDRYKYGTAKIAAADGTPVPTKELQNKLFNLIYKLSKTISVADGESHDTKSVQFP